MKLTGKNIVLTGASSGIGLAILKELLRFEDINIFAVDIKPLSQGFINNPKVEFRAFDLSKKTDIEQVVAQAKFYMGCIDIFICNAGYGIYDFKYQSSYEEIKAIFELNTLSPIYTANLMLQEDNQTLTVHMASAMGELALPGYGLYAATKAALLKYADAFQLDNKGQHKLLTVLPIATSTNFFESLRGETAKAPWPTMSPAKVAAKVIEGIEKDKKKVYPSKLNLIMRFFLAIHELLHLPYQRFYRKS